MKYLTIRLITVLSCAGSAWTMDEGRPLSIATLPPCVVSTQPVCGTADVDARTTVRISVTFSKDMNISGWSWAQMSRDHFPEFTTRPHYLDDQRTCVVNVKLLPGTTYVIRLNSPNHRNFKDRNGLPAVPYLLVFQTRPDGGP